jgi:hypothetical protein
MMHFFGSYNSLLGLIMNSFKFSVGGSRLASKSLETPEVQMCSIIRTPNFYTHLLMFVFLSQSVVDSSLLVTSLLP